MTGRQIANLCCRVLAVYALMCAIGSLSNALPAIVSAADPRFQRAETIARLIGFIGEPILYVGMALFLWRWSQLVAAWMVGHDLQDAANEPDVSPHRPSAAEIHAIAFSTLGLWLVGTSVPLLLAYLTQAWSYGDALSEEPVQIRAGWAAAFINETLRVALGVYLLFGASGLVALLRRARNFGLLETERPEYASSNASPPQAANQAPGRE